MERWPDSELEGEWLYLGNRWEMAEPPPELYLRQARRLDPAHPGAVALEIARTVGGVCAPEDLSFQRLARDIADAADGSRESFSASWDRTYGRPEFIAGRGWKVHVDEIAYRLRILHRLGRHAVAYRRGDYLAEAWQGHLLSGSGDPERKAWETFCRFIDPALARFHVRVEITYAAGFQPSNPGTTFLEAGALQIVNDLARVADYMTCPNCGQVFARQVGASQHYSRRKGVTYCSPSCATAARVKAYRARKRAEGENGAQ